MWPQELLRSWSDNSLPFHWSVNRLYIVWKMLCTTYKLWASHRNWWQHPVSNMSYQGDHFYVRCATILVKTVSEMMSWLNFLNAIQVSFDSFQITAEVKRNLICGTLLACQGTLIDDRLSEMAHLVSSFLFVRHPHFAQLFVVIYKPLLLFVRQIACNAHTHTLWLVNHLSATEQVKRQSHQQIPACLKQYVFILLLLDLQGGTMQRHVWWCTLIYSTLLQCNSDWWCNVLY